MSSEDLIFSRQINYKGFLDFKELKDGMKSLLIDGLGYTVDEIYHSFSDKSSGGNHEIKWNVYKQPDKYVKFDWQITFITGGLKQVKVVGEKGDEVKKQEGKVRVLFRVKLTTDWLNRWDSGPFTRFLRAVYEKYVYGKYNSPGDSRGVYKRWAVQVEQDAIKVFDEAKALLNLYGER